MIVNATHDPRFRELYDRTDDAGRAFINSVLSECMTEGSPLATKDVEAKEPATNGTNGAHSFLSRDAILALDDRQYETVFVPEWNSHVMVRGLTAGERDRWESDAVQIKGNIRTIKGDMRASLIAKTVVDPNTKEPMFTRGDVERLAAKSARATERLFDAARKLSGMTEADVESLEKNSGTLQRED